MVVALHLNNVVISFLEVRAYPILKRWVYSNLLLYVKIAYVIFLPPDSLLVSLVSVVYITKLFCS